MNRISLALAAFLISLTFTACKKENPEANAAEAAPVIVENGPAEAGPDGRTIEQERLRVAFKKYSEEEILPGTPEWYTDLVGTQAACVHYDRILAFERIGKLEDAELIGSDLGGHLESIITNHVTAFAQAAFLPDFSGCGAVEIPEGKTFFSRHQAVEKMRSFEINPQEFGLTPVVMREKLVSAAKRVASSPGGVKHLTEGCPNDSAYTWYFDEFQRYQFTAQELGVNLSAWDDYLNGHKRCPPGRG